jgi:hypothetical protein
MAGTACFTHTHDVLVVLAWVLNLASMTWLAVVARRAQDLEPVRSGNDGAGHRDA